ncbi:MAG: phosphatidylserine decarboxylase [Bacilli bacterium]|nr:phosphatidylserine decarboxylase [Bacilli bacterium]MDD3896036.1 phosphatidylserine decarboxylase [Bacilli bacterium]MDD4407910.1 phosphatidylserine decarboxylase [Bacilli bacterium]
MDNFKLKNQKEDKFILFFYNTIIGRLLLKILTINIISKIVGLFLSTRLSKSLIKRFIKKNNINMNDYKDIKYKSFNNFFIREIKAGKRPINNKNNALISPCDGRLLVYKINNANIFKIKNSYYDIHDLIKNDVSNEYLNGYALIFRLCVNDYHRYCYIDNGIKSDNNYIKGILHTVRPVAFDKYNVYKTNSREWTILKTENFGNVIQIEVGALCVGKIVNHHQQDAFKKGEEKGYFKFGGSTIILLFKENTIKINKEILKNSLNNIETIVKLGEKIGNKS